MSRMEQESPGALCMLCGLPAGVPPEKKVFQRHPWLRAGSEAAADSSEASCSKASPLCALSTDVLQVAVTPPQ